MNYAPEGYMYYSIKTPQVFKEVLLPEYNEDMTAAQRRQFRELERLAEAHGTHITPTTFQRG